ncbi:insulinase family protein [Ancylomarina sp. 16SWW S1-10-2]|uniref:insulinase family protein n=1 Tax=Ancylomarina sp. 16SWW S1-10-2 TaxID=2499681 RepID=UPI0012AE38DE|nr:insulinase family protein [Ancylomarina sp. 16SWW S1-10-2]MRT94839.1 peptidase [Ancylomarina sp. 16SWW S1-10-2]
MKKRKLHFLFVAALAVLTACTPKEKFQTGEQYHGFTLVEKRFVKEVDANCLLFKHDKSGAQLLKIATPDQNKMFNIAFKTTPQNDYGTPHMMEHSVLNGSKNFPVKSPFDILIKGSLNTYLNAMTGSDFTTYPVASMNDKDYFNLMHVYLDAVFNPNIYTEPRIFKQEGWHYELTSLDDDIVYKGVVYNEMKGSFSNPSRELDYQVNKVLFPDNTYGVSSGGYPKVIPKLTYEDFINFHKKYYHPGNSYIMLYGNGDLDKELTFIDNEYLSKYDLPTEKIVIPLQKPFDKMKEVEKSYAVADGASTKDQTFLDLSIVAGEGVDVALGLTYDVLADALVNHESAPLRLALQEAGIGSDVYAYYNASKQGVFEITVENANPEDKDQFKEIVYNTMKDVAKKGFDKKMVEGILNRMEFDMKEGNTPQKGMMYLFQSYQSWLFANDPFLGLEYTKPLEKVKTALTTNLLETTLTQHLTNNPHAVLMVLKPEPGLQAKLTKEVKDELKAYKDGLSTAEKEELVASTKDLIAYQKREDTPEAIATIPMLGLADISKDIEWFGVDKKDISGLEVLHHNAFTNSILYSNLYFDIRVLPKDLIPYAELLSSLLGKLNTENYTYGELDNALNIQIGGFNTYTTSFLEDHSDDKMIPKFAVYTKATTDKAANMFKLADEIINHSKINDKSRLKELLTRIQASVDSDVKNNGLNYAMTRLRSYYSKSGAYSEKTSGLDFYRFVTDLSENFDAKSDELIANLEKTAALLFNKDNMIGSVTCNDKDFVAYEKGIKGFTATLKAEPVTLNDWKFDFEKKNEGIKTASKVQYVVEGYDFKKLGYEYNGKMRVLNQILSTDWLQTQVRVLGGAYGGFAGISESGNVYFASYRDPNLSETFDNYNKTPDYLDKFDATDKEMTRYIIGTISRMDGPMTASQEGNRAIRYYFEKTTPEALKAEREAVLSTTPEDIKGMEKMVADVLSQDAICVYGNEEKVEENAKLFKNVIGLKE